MKKILYSLIFIFLLFVFVGCSEMSDASTDGRYEGGDSLTPTDDYDDGSYKSGSGGEEEPTEPQTPQAGQMSASEWSDLKNYDFYKSLFGSTQDQQESQFMQYFNKGYFDTLNMVDVTVKNGNNKISGASVELLDSNQQVIYKAITNENGIAYLFPQNDQLSLISHINIKHQSAVLNEAFQYDTNNTSLSYDLSTTSNKEETIEIMFVVDTTGSMGDEINFLKSEIDYVISEVQTANEDATIKLALLFYRDRSDSYVTRYFDFTTDINIQKINLAAQNAAGGGDFEEAVDIALDEAVNKNWSSTNTTKLLFHVLDAPPHYTQQNMSKYFDAINTASEKGIRIIPIASSGIDKYTEYLLRNEAMMSGGTYVFITNDSGIGGDHIDANVGETEVEYLNLLMIRLINEFYTGIEGQKVPYGN